MQHKLPIFERLLTLWVAICIIVGTAIGYILGDSIQPIAELTINSINIPIALLVWLMIYPMMVQIDFSKGLRIHSDKRGLALTLIINWVVKPFTMAFFAWIFFHYIFQSFLSPDEALEYFAGAVLLGAAPCTAMVFVWSYLSDGDPNYTLVQVSINDLVLLILFVPIVQLLLNLNSITVPYNVLITSVVVFVVIPLIAGYLSNVLLIKKHGEDWFKTKFLPKLKPVSIFALLGTLVLLFAFQGQQLLDKPFNILLIAIPLTIQTYFIFFVAWKFGKSMKLSYAICAPGSMIGASNFFELAVAVAIATFGIESGATLATVVGVLIEVPIMLSLVKYANNHKY